MSVTCREATALAAEAELGTLDEAGRMRLELHVQGCDACAASERRVRGVAALLRDAPGEASGGASDLAIVSRALLAAGQPAPAARPVRRAPRRLGWAAAALALAAVGGASWWGLAGRDARVEVAGDAPPPVAAPEPDPTPVPLPAAPRRPLAATELVRPCPGVVARGPDAVAFVVASEPRRCVLEVASGELALRVDPAERISVAVRTAHAEVSVLGTLFSVRPDEDGTRVVVERGRVRVVTELGQLDLGAAEASWAAGGRPGRSEPATEAGLSRLRALASELGLVPAPTVEAPSPPADAGRRLTELRGLLRSAPPAVVRGRVERAMRDPALARSRGELLTIVAESHLADGAYARALEAYGEVWRGPRSSTAGNALLAGADVALRRLGDARRARGLYERYLSEYPNGPLRELASAGRCRALRAGGDAAEAERCAAEHAEAFPRGGFGTDLDQPPEASPRRR